MQFRRFGRLDWKVSALGFGAMRLPTTDGKPMSGNIIEDEATRMIRHAIDQGVNYVDTAYPYHDGKSEVVLGRILTDGYREKVRLATKSPIWLVKAAEDFDTYLNQQLERLHMDYVDFYLFHGLNGKTWDEKVLGLGLLDRAEAALKDGRIRHLGFSFHDGLDAFKKIIDGYDKWEFCQVQYNYMDTEREAGTEGVKYAASKGLGIIVMEPLLGGRLSRPPPDVRSILESSGTKRTPSGLALQWIWDHPEVSVILSGMSASEQVEENLTSASRSASARLGPDELELVARVKQKYKERTLVPCTSCSYCMPCPGGVNIPECFELYNTGYAHDDLERVRLSYERFLDEKSRASACTQCKECEEKCPQKIKVSELMPKVHAVLGEKKPY